ncbi:hypothetical protein BFP97_00760 [Roseivirga sp. 4D4]|uniref:hypothetical protein n=1 Tax=Roseivirga sp. 4D4 TaxID=1889784 RepID=UPI000853CBA5|nr:hypothetical protein [Roseivirga sp. 4D4]OEK00133.1 hypothetical protein BFP97_00760 [Roseivirga sp. 4D4]
MKANRWLNEVKIIKKALTEPEYQQKLIQTPKAAIEELLGRSIGKTKVQILKENEEVMHLIFPNQEGVLGEVKLHKSLEQKTPLGYVRKLIEAQAIDEALKKGQNTFHLSPEDLRRVVVQSLKLADVPDYFKVQLHHEPKGTLYIAIPHRASKAYSEFKLA